MLIRRFDSFDSTLKVCYIMWFLRIIGFALTYMPMDLCTKLYKYSRLRVFHLSRYSVSSYVLKETKVLDCGRGLLIRPLVKDRKNQLIFYIHGGGFVAGSPDMYLGFLSTMCNRLSCSVFCPNYLGRGEEERSIETMSKNILIEYRHLCSSGTTPTIVMGDSAGGTLCIRLLQQLQGRELPDKMVLLSPWMGPFGEQTVQKQKKVTVTKDYLSTRLLGRHTSHIMAQNEAWFKLFDAVAKPPDDVDMLVIFSSCELLADGINEKIAHYRHVFPDWNIETLCVDDVHHDFMVTGYLSAGPPFLSMGHLKRFLFPTEVCLMVQPMSIDIKQVLGCHVDIGEIGEERFASSTVDERGYAMWQNTTVVEWDIGYENIDSVSLWFTIMSRKCRRLKFCVALSSCTIGVNKTHTSMGTFTFWVDVLKGTVPQLMAA